MLQKFKPNTPMAKPFNQRPHFIMNKKKITAGGLLIMNFETEKCLLQYSTKKNRFEDLGGKAEYTDDTIIHSIVREVYEESNRLIGAEDNKISFKNAQFFYIHEAKYILVVIDSKDINIETDMKKYGIIEEHTNFERYLNWIDIPNILENKVEVNPRILHYFNNTCENVSYLFDFLQKEKEYFIKEELKVVETIEIAVQSESPSPNLFEIKDLMIVAGTCTVCTVLWGLRKYKKCFR